MYIADDGNNRVMRYPMSSTTGTNGTIVAGGAGAGNTNTQLNNPWGLYYLPTISNYLYITNAAGHSVMRWIPGASSGEFIAGTPGVSGSNATTLNTPLGIKLDSYLNMFVVDYLNNRVQMFCQNNQTGVTIVGNGTAGSSAIQLNGPRGLAFDSSMNLRPDVNDEQEEISYSSTGHIAETISFEELKERNVTSEQLLKWFAPINIAEKYEMNGNSSDIFHNCSLPWFGSMCQYKLDYDLSLSFGDIVQATLANELNYTNGTCYRFLTGCNRGAWPMCFDWREICDGKIDCINGEDEQWCGQLEMTKCTDNEYRCHYGGQCIPLTFAKDSSRSIDCLDGSDEAEFRSFSTLMNPDCSHISTFRCQERIGRYPWSFPCGDDQFNGLVILKPPPSIADVWNKDCESLTQHCSSEWLVIPAYPILFGFFQFLYFTNRSVDQFKENIIPDLVCFNEQSCPMLLTKIDSVQIINGLTCCHPSNLIEFTEAKDFNDLAAYFGFYYHRCLKTGIENSCINSSYFYCNESKKCIPNYRVGDGAPDCIFREDESFNTCQWNDSNRFKCESDSNKCLSSVALGNGLAECPSTEDELFSYTQNLIILTPFPELCNHYNNRKIYPLELTETDETNCDWWPCNNPYTKCDKYWNCPNGADELNCPNTKCSFNELVCYKEHFESSYCIPLVHMYEKYLDPCDDTDLLREFYFYNETTNINDDYFSWNDSKCITSDKICRINHDLQTESTEEEELCLYQYGGLMQINPVVIFQNKEYLCEFELRTGNDDFERFFKSTGLGNYPEISTNRSISFMSRIHKNEKMMLHIDSESTSFCHRGIAVLNGMDETKKCFCPPNYFGSRCQWQNQRISLSLQLIYHSMTSINAIFQVIIILVDEDNGSTSNHEQITYMPTRDCDTKFNIYLLYPDRPKNLLSNYSIRIDLYEKTELDYWASWYLSIPFRFLPVNRIAAKLLIPEIPEIQSCSLPCGEHGKCKRYINEKFLFFCYCDQGYSGTYCNITHKCDCANGSLCVDSSICICPLYKFGTYCYLKHSVCQTPNNLCQNNGICIPTDDRISSTGFTCFCPESYSGERCQNENNRIDIHLDDKIISTTSLLLHFITGFNNAEHERISILKKISFYQKILTIYVSQPFNILLVEIPNQYYYLVVLRQVFIPSENISVEIQSKQRCSSIDELDNNTFAQYGYFNRTKYYPLLCRQYLELMCFYDQDLMCICDTNRFSNCFLFDKNMNNDYQGYNYCENGGQGFQNNNTCPTKFKCICPACFYGTRCQFSSEGIIFSLDAILGYHIQPHVSLNQQPLIIKLNIVISTILFLLGLFNGVLSFLLFRKKKIRQVGTGYYLLFSSLTSIFNIILLIIKFWLLILSQMSLITNRSFLYFNCITIDVSFKILLASNEWLNACVAIERMVSASKGTSFNKKKSRKISKWVIISVFILTILTHIHDPLHRKLIDDMATDEQRIWCFVKYSGSVNIYNSFIALFHFLITFLINIICGLWIIKSLAYNRRNVHRDQTFQQHLKYQIQQHRHLLIAPCLLVLVNIPGLIISVSSGCMKSAREPWLYLAGYYLSFIPSMLTFIIFVLPSKTYKTEFNATIEETKRRCGIRS
ncbi:unnamed protein product [Adineta steineri]|uniref:Uncharacterized protein n=1 Tax=Adineta steineri TaxID=433720 RepID=A0A818PZM1_9BILA|nr:unnamed protein product [Adineta steineri]